MRGRPARWSRWAIVALVIVATSLGATTAGSTTVTVTLSPQPMPAGGVATITWTITPDTSVNCQNFGSGFDSTITLTPSGGGSSLPPIMYTAAIVDAHTMAGTLTIPLSTPPGDYDVAANCSWAADSAISKSTTLSVTEAETPPSGGGGDGTAPDALDAQPDGLTG